MRQLLTILLAVSSVLAWAEPKPAQLEILFSRVRIVDVEHGVVLPPAEVWIKSGRIQSIAKHALVYPGKKLQLVNASGKFLIPGLWDMHVHLLQQQSPEEARHSLLPLLIANGITGARDMGGDLDLLLALRNEIQSGKLLGPRLVVSGPMLDGENPPYPASIALHNSGEARRAVADLKRRGADFIKLQSTLTREEFYAIAAEAKQQRIPFAGHVPDSVTPAEASDAGQKSQEHLLGLLLACSSREDEIRRADRDFQQPTPTPQQANAYGAGRRNQIVTSYDPQKAAALFQRFVNNGTWQVPTLVFLETMADWSDPRLISDPLLKYIPASRRQVWEKERTGFLAGRDPANLAGWKNYFQGHDRLIAGMRQSGVGILAGTDSGAYEFPGFALHQELQLLVRAGLTPAQALRAATLAPARFLGLDQQLGTIEVGKVADLVLLDADPLQDIANTQAIAGVVVNGRWLSRADLDRMLAQVEAAAKPQ